jgi:hypothetical protein
LFYRSPTEINPETSMVKLDIVEVDSCAWEVRAVSNARRELSPDCALTMVE